MNLVIEIGNSAVKCGIFEGEALRKVVALPTARASHSFTILREFSRLPIRSVAIASVVPSVGATISRSLKRLPFPEAILVTPRTCGMKINVRNPRTVGIDRLLNARAAYHVCRGPCVIVDIGTAVTIDAVSRRGAFLGGVILPGPSLWLRSLTGTALLPTVSFSPRVALPGRNTREAMQAGARYGLAFTIMGIAGTLAQKYCAGSVFLTGGWGSIFRRFLPADYVHRPHLTIEGLNLVVGDRRP